MPSLRDWYEKLSGAIHEAREDAKLFDDAVPEINRHFNPSRSQDRRERKKKCRSQELPFEFLDLPAADNYI